MIVAPRPFKTAGSVHDNAKGNRTRYFTLEECDAKNLMCS